jgi:glycosyltransferase involved in cell wall biosynthesis
MAGRAARIGFVIDDLGYGGAQRQLSILIPALRPHFEPHVFCLSQIDEPFGRNLRDAGVAVECFPRRSHADLTRLLALRRSVSRRRIDLVHGILSASNVYAFLTARTLQIPCVLSLRSDRIVLGGAKGAFLRYAYRRADAVTVNSRAGARFLSESVRLAEGRIVLVRNCVPAVVGAATVTGKHPDSPVVGYVGRLTAEKRIPLLLEAFRLVRANVANASLVLVGDGESSAALRELAKRLLLERHVVFAGPAEDVASRLAGFDCLVLPSAFEGLPNAAVEALLLGVPVVASRAGDVEQIVVNGKTGLLHDGDDAGSLARLIERAISDRALRSSAASEGPRLVREIFSTERTVAETVSLYRRLLARS